MVDAGDRGEPDDAMDIDVVPVAKTGKPKAVKPKKNKSLPLVPSVAVPESEVRSVRTTTLRQRKENTVAAAALKPPAQKRCPKPKKKRASPMAAAAAAALPDGDDDEMVDDAPVPPPRAPRKKGNNAQRMADRAEAKRGWVTYTSPEILANSEIKSFGRDCPTRRAAKICAAKNTWLSRAYQPTCVD